MTSLLIVKDIEANVHEIKEYVNFSIYLSSKNDLTRTIKIYREMHLVKELKTNMLIKNDILVSKNIIIDVQQKRITIRSCESLIIDVKIHQRESFI
jgi:transcriptional regulator with AAA-type ATPase domain